MELRLATHLDLAQLAECRWEHWLEDGQDIAQRDQTAFSQEFTSWLAPKLGDSWFVWCAIENEVVLSHVYVHKVGKLPKPSALADQFGYVTNVYTRAHHRNKGIGSELISKVKVWALESDLEFLVLWPSEASTPFWRREGFDETEALSVSIRPYIN